MLSLPKMAAACLHHASFKTTSLVVLNIFLATALLLSLSRARWGSWRHADARERAALEDLVITAYDVDYHGPQEWGMLPPMPGAAWEDALRRLDAVNGVVPVSAVTALPAGKPLKKVGLYLNTLYHWEALMAIVTFLCMSGRYEVYIWTAAKWPFDATMGRGDLLRAFPYCFELYTGQVELDALLCASHTYANWGLPTNESFVQDDPHYSRWIKARPMKRLVFAVHELLENSLDVLDYDPQVRVLSIPPMGFGWDLPVLLMYRTFLPALPTRLLGGAGGVRRFVLQGAQEDAKRDYAALVRLLNDPALRPFDGQYEVLYLGNNAWGKLPQDLVAAPGFRVIPFSKKGDKYLDETTYHEHCRSAHFILPLVSPRRKIMYWTTRLTSSVMYAWAYRLVAVTHEAVVRQYRFPRGTVLAHGDAPASLLHAFLRALRMSDEDFQAARDAYGPALREVDAANVESLRVTLEEH